MRVQLGACGMPFLPEQVCECCLVGPQLRWCDPQLDKGNLKGLQADQRGAVSRATGWLANTHDVSRATGWLANTHDVKGVVLGCIACDRKQCHAVQGLPQQPPQ